jgi:hypothetical protein
LVGEKKFRKKTHQGFLDVGRRSTCYFFTKNIANNEELEKYEKRNIKRKGIKLCRKNLSSFFRR